MDGKQLLDYSLLTCLFTCEIFSRARHLVVQFMAAFRIERGSLAAPQTDFVDAACPRAVVVIHNKMMA